MPCPLMYSLFQHDWKVLPASNNSTSGAVKYARRCGHVGVCANPKNHVNPAGGFGGEFRSAGHHTKHQLGCVASVLTFAVWCVVCENRLK